MGRPSNLLHAKLIGLRVSCGNDRSDRSFRVRVTCEVRNVDPPSPVRMPMLDREVSLQMIHRRQSSDTKGKEKLLLSCRPSHGRHSRRGCDASHLSDAPEIARSSNRRQNVVRDARPFSSIPRIRQHRFPPKPNALRSSAEGSSRDRARGGRSTEPTRPLGAVRRVGLDCSRSSEEGVPRWNPSAIFGIRYTFALRSVPRRMWVR